MGTRVSCIGCKIREFDILDGQAGHGRGLLKLAKIIGELCFHSAPRLVQGLPERFPGNIQGAVFASSPSLALCKGYRRVDFLEFCSVAACASCRNLTKATTLERAFLIPGSAIIAEFDGPTSAIFEMSFFKLWLPMPAALGR
jgi:hypothetical protein